MQVHTCRGKVFQVWGMVTLFVLIVILPVSAAGIASVTSPGVLPYTQGGTSPCQQNRGGY